MAESSASSASGSCPALSVRGRGCGRRTWRWTGTSRCGTRRRRRPAEVDVYAGSLAGLVVVEVEFAGRAQAEAFVPAAWFGQELTGLAAAGAKTRHRPLLVTVSAGNPG